MPRLPSLVALGRRARVSIEFALDPDLVAEHPTWLFGHLQLWAGGEPIGRHDETCALTVALASFPSIVERRGRRGDPWLMARSAEAAFGTIHAALYGDQPDLSYPEVATLACRYERFEVRPRGFDVFDGWQAYLIEDRLRGWLLWRRPDGIVRETRIGAGEFDRIVASFLAALDQASRQARRPAG